jgi:hypothetical protein
MVEAMDKFIMAVESGLAEQEHEFMSGERFLREEANTFGDGDEKMRKVVVGRFRNEAETKSSL